VRGYCDATRLAAYRSLVANPNSAMRLRTSSSLTEYSHNSQNEHSPMPKA